jgi:SAM-dependent methyltransferase
MTIVSAHSFVGKRRHSPRLEDAQFDLVVCRLTLHQVGDPAAVVREMVRVTKDGGRIAVIDMIADPTPGSCDEIRQRLDGDMQAGFPTGLRPARDADGQVTFVHPWIAAVARVGHGPDK